MSAGAAAARAASFPYGTLFRSEVFRSGEEGYHTYRIPSLVVTAKGALLAFCEGRKEAAGDTGNIDVVMKRSSDQGKTWGPLQIVADHGPHTIGNPCPVVDRADGTIWMPLTGNDGKTTQDQILAGQGKRPMYMAHSKDDGKTWSEPVDISASIADPSWTWNAAGPGTSIQTRTGRLVVPCDFSAPGSRTEHSYVIYSDDHGRTWKRGGIAGDKMGEAAIVELADGSLMLNTRSAGGVGYRSVSHSRDGGLTWSGVKLEKVLTEARGGCQGSIIRFTQEPKDSRNRLLFSNPAGARRYNLTVRLSYDEGESWRMSRVLQEGPSSYSSMAVLPDRTVGCVFENGDKQINERLSFARFDLEWVSGGEDKL